MFPCHRFTVCCPRRQATHPELGLSDSNRCPQVNSLLLYLSAKSHQRACARQQHFYRAMRLHYGVFSGFQIKIKSRPYSQLFACMRRLRVFSWCIQGQDGFKHFTANLNIREYPVFPGVKREQSHTAHPLMVCFLIVAFACLRRVTTPLRSFRPLPLLSSYLAKLDGQFLLTRRLFPLPYRFTYKIATSILGKILARFLQEPLSRFQEPFLHLEIGSGEPVYLSCSSQLLLAKVGLYGLSGCRPSYVCKDMQDLNSLLCAQKRIHGTPVQVTHLPTIYQLLQTGNSQYLCCMVQTFQIEPEVMSLHQLPRN